ncbi:MAG: hypothetical protein FJW37_07290, partial [Acidobacteria bacterium]|nr:hypothetical protein [Acidobacteriota bacterium]
FARDVAPILAANCAGCHAGNARMGSLDLDTHESLMRGGTHGAVIVPGKSEESRLYLMISGRLAPAMPLSGKSLAAGETDIIRRWIDAGAAGDPAGAAGDQRMPGRLAPPPPPRIQPRRPVNPEIGALAWRGDGKLLALGGFREVRLADASGKAVATFAGQAEKVLAVAFSPDGRFLAAAGGQPGRGGEIRIWDVERRAELRAIQGHSDAIYAVAFSPDGRELASSSYDKLVKIWDFASGKEIRTLKDHIDAVYGLAFTADGRRLVSAAADRTVKVWDRATGARLYTLAEPADGLNTVVLDAAAKRVAAGGQDKTIRIWSLGENGGTLLHSLIAHEDAILKLAFSPDGKLLASTSADRTIKVFRAEDLAEVKVYGNQPDWVLGLEFSPDGKTLAAGRFDGSLELIPVPRAEVYAQERR